MLMSVGRAESLGLEVRDRCRMPVDEQTLPGFKALLRNKLHPWEILILLGAGDSTAHRQQQQQTPAAFSASF